MRVAICFYGLVGSRSGKGGESVSLDPAISFDLYKKHIFEKNKNVDVFIHSWSVECQHALKNLYQPRLSVFQKQLQFPESKTKIYTKRSFLSRLNYLVGRLVHSKKFRKMKEGNEKGCFRSYSRWYSSKKVLGLKKEYEREHGFEYDAVMITRLDVGFFKDLVFDDYDMECFYASHRNTPPWRSESGEADRNNNFQETEFSDFWFFSNSGNMDKFATVFDELNNYDEISPHISSKTHVDKHIGSEKIRYVFYRWFDHEMIRRKFYGSKE